jgi:V8-like Glu-specific endopeptidase
MQTHRIRTVQQLLFLVLTLSFIALGFGARFSHAAAQALFVTSEGSAAARAVVRPYTEEEILSAVPADWAAADTAPEGDVVPRAFREYMIGKPGVIMGSLPEGKRRAGAETDPEKVFSATPEALFTTSTGYPGPFTRYENFSGYQVYPYRAIGRIFFRDVTNGQIQWCTASSIGNHAVWTAGHCVSDGRGRWHSNWVFIPAFRQTGSTVSMPYGQWTGSYAIAFNEWHTARNNARDSAGVILRPLNGQTINQAVGALGFAWNQDPALTHWHAFGYPGNIGNGQRQIICAAGLTEIDTSKPAPRPVGMGCDMQGGASGGPWIKSFGSGNFLNGNVSYGYPTLKPLEFFSPYFDTASKQLRDQLVSRRP